MRRRGLPRARYLAPLLASVFFIVPTRLRAEGAASDPVQDLHRLLESSPETLVAGDPALAKRLNNASAEERQRLLLQAREHALVRHIKALTTIGDMRRALADDHWEDSERTGSELGRLDAHYRAVLVKQLQDKLRRILRDGDEVDRLGALTVIRELGMDLRGVDRQSSVGLALVPDIAKQMVAGREPAVRVAAALALGKVNPDPEQAAPALATLLSANAVRERRGAAAALSLFLHTITEGFTRYRRSQFIEVVPGRLITVGRSILPLAGKGLADPDAAVRRDCLQALRAGADALQALIPEVPDPEEPRAADEKAPPVQQLFALTQPISFALATQIPAVARGLSDAESAVRLAALQTLETNAQVRLRLSRYLHEGPPPRDGVPNDPLAGPLSAVVEPLAQQLAEKDVELRLSALYVLETLEDLAAPAAPAVAKVVGDADAFVRWAAARTLGKIAPKQAETAVPVLAKLVDDANADVRRSALTNLARFAGAANTAVPALRQAVNHRDTDTQILAMEALAAIGGGAAPATPELTRALSAPDSEVRLAAAKALGKIGKPAAAALEALRRALNDSDETVRLEAAEALLNIKSAGR
jgi:HEAT repeat protein